MSCIQLSRKSTLRWEVYQKSTDLIFRKVPRDFVEGRIKEFNKTTAVAMSCPVLNIWSPNISAMCTTFKKKLYPRLCSYYTVIWLYIHILYIVIWLCIDVTYIVILFYVEINIEKCIYIDVIYIVFRPYVDKIYSNLTLCRHKHRFFTVYRRNVYSNLTLYAHNIHSNLTVYGHRNLTLYM
jgi:hypothetical protein